MPEDTATPANSPQKGIPPAMYALIGTIITAMVGVLVVYFQVITPKLIELHATQTAEILHINMTDTALARIPTSTATMVVPTATFTPTSISDTLTPTLTSTLTLSPTPITSTVTPTFTPTPRPTATLDIDGFEYCVNARSIYVRDGPGTEYSYIGALTYQDCPFFDARNPDSSWIRVSAGQPGYEPLSGGWVRTDLVRPTDFDTLPVIEPTPTPTPTDTPEPPPTLTPTNTPLG
jgi:hypothetical protein